MCLEKQKELLDELVSVGKVVYGEILISPINAIPFMRIENKRNILALQHVYNGLQVGWFEIHVPAKHKRLLVELKNNTAKIREKHTSAWLTLSVSNQSISNQEA